MNKIFKHKMLLVCSLVALILLSFGQAEAKKKPKPDIFPIGVTQQAKEEHFQASLFFLQPCVIEPEGAALAPKKADIHLRACVQPLLEKSGDKDKDKADQAAAPLLDGFTITYKMVKQETGESVAGELLPLTCEQGPCYGTNLKLYDMGTYNCEFTFTQPGRPEVKPVTLKWLFKFIPRKKW